MDAKSRRTLEMGNRALEFSRVNPDPSPGHEAAVGQLQDFVNRGELLADQQRGGFLEVRVATSRKRDLRRALRKGHLAHLANVARVAEKELPGLRVRFRLSLAGGSYLTFRTAARGMLAEMMARKDVLEKHGLSATVLDGLAQGLDQFDAAVKQGVEGRRAHIGASADLRAVADEIAQIVRVMDALNEVRFAGNEELLSAWRAASSVVTPRKAAPDGEELKPAA